MTGWNRDSLGSLFGRRPSWLTCSVVLLQTLVIAAYFLPWHEGEDGLLIWAYSELATDPPSHLVFVLASVLVCFAAALISMGLISCTLLLKANRPHVLRVASLLNSLAIAGPLFYPPGWLRQLGAWPDVWLAVREADIGWFMALLFGSGASLLILWMFYEADKSVGEYQIPRERLLRYTRRNPFSVAMTLLVAVGVALAVTGYILTWSSGRVVVLNSFWSWSMNGIDSSPPMCLVLIAAISSFALFLLDQFIVDRRVMVLSAAAQSALVAALALTLLWGLAMSEYEIPFNDVYHSYSTTVVLHEGWYVCVAGQSIALVGLLLFPRVRRYLAKENDAQSDHSLM